jgi:methyl-accepting chemotaxis protein
VNHFLSQARNLADASPHLAMLRTSTGSLYANIKQYEQFVSQTEQANHALTVLRISMGKTIDLLRQTAKQFLENQYALMQQELVTGMQSENLAERLSKIIAMQTFVELISTIRMNNLNAKLTGEPELLRSSLAMLPEAQQFMKEIQRQTQQTENLSTIEEIFRLTNAYFSDTQVYLQQWLELQQITEQRQAVADEVLNIAETIANDGIGETTQLVEATAVLLANTSHIMIIGLIVVIILGAFIAVFMLPHCQTVIEKYHFAEAIAGRRFNCDQRKDRNDEAGILSRLCNNGKAASNNDPSDRTLPQLASGSRVSFQCGRHDIRRIGAKRGG